MKSKEQEMFCYYNNLLQLQLLYKYYKIQITKYQKITKYKLQIYNNHYNNTMIEF